MPETANVFNEASLIVGVGGGSPSLCLLSVSPGSAAPVKLADFSSFGKTLSVYALAASPNLHYLVAATRSHVDRNTGKAVLPGVLLTWDLQALLRQPNLKYNMPPGPIRSLPGFTSVAIKNDGVFLVGTCDGRISLYSLQTGAVPQASAQACSIGEVYAVVALSQDRWASNGADGVLRIWRASGAELQMIWESEPFVPVKLGALQALYWSEAKQALCWGCGDGQVHWLDLQSLPPRQQSWKAHQGTVLASVWHPETKAVLSGGLDDGKLACWDLGDSANCRFSIDIQAQIVGLWPLIGKRIAVMTIDGRIMTCDLKPEATPFSVVSLCARSWIGYPLNWPWRSVKQMCRK